MRTLAVLTVRNEAAFLLEWLAHHTAVGITDFLVFSNDCQDGSDLLLDRLATLGHVTHVRNDGPYDARGIQFTALALANRHEAVRSADWILPLDIDEFVNVHVGDGSLDALRGALPKATAITLTWRLFGNADMVRYVDGSILQTFVRCAPAVMNWPWRSAMFKTLYRNDGTYRKLGVHRPRDPDPARLDDARWYDGEGRTLEDRFRTRGIFSPYGRPNHALVQLNHYPLGAMESFVLKADRGRAVHSDHMLGLDYWVERNWNTDTDTSIHRYLEATERIHAGFLTDPETSALHEQAVSWRTARFETLMCQEPFRALFGRLMMAGPSRPVSQEAARFMTAFALRRDSPPKS